ncbi:hypothetical protein C8A03DRAFT_34861 [Achaetomium macrosporum]|uniref:Uncharacterized protein n=1 Tax=Achaetomium macrosporum TaxID=79813 RepID=A0AAN7C894_9PEZI|nr:hypothetical protein C8A03DRAFT_34861 [Achaetomium macrosporum]
MSLRWLSDNTERADGMDLAVAIEGMHYSDMAVDSEKATLSPGASPAVMTMRGNFTGFWRMWQAPGGNAGLIKRDYALLTEIHPNMIETAEESFLREDKKARKNGRESLWDMVLDPRPILKVHEDRSLTSQRMMDVSICQL